jgi:hypothetical protein
LDEEDQKLGHEEEEEEKEIAPPTNYPSKHYIECVNRKKCK